MGFQNDIADGVTGHVHITSSTPAMAPPRAAQSISGTGATAATHAIAMLPGSYATFVATPGTGGTGVRICCSDQGTVAPAAHDATHPWRPLAGGGEYNWIPESFTKFIWVVALDGSSAFSGVVAQSS